ncbi:CHAT domain-containing protein [Oscillatoria sp. CS-180]|uniref:CHAT domain-containing protein n=1 Tax=Oscillatoria sp. CS-180 TaxID=3021720 RepID=UPI00232B0552|nr:CHAT domain-containing protein [Oscillatoria sp. CS-180]MDB9525491.1 CHAT domain-containing protein [Oscillatoria sp. CS-180]
MPEPIRLRIAIERLSSSATPHYAIWVVKAPHPGGYVHHDRPWTDELNQLWQSWLQLFSLRGLPQVPHVPSAYIPQFVTADLGKDTSSGRGYTGRLMQTLGVKLWQWLFDGAIKSSLDQSLGIAMGQGNPLCLCLDIRDPALISLPWEIMQSQPGRQAMSLSEHIRFSRTTSDVDPLADISLNESLKILLVLGEPDVPSNDPNADRASETLQLENEANTLRRILLGEVTSGLSKRPTAVSCQVDVLVRPRAADLIKALENGQYNVFFYAGHGVPAPDGGLIFLQAQSTLNGTELAQLLTHNRVKLAVFNTCWGAQPDQQGQRTISRSSLAEVLLHHGVPAVIAMRDSIADEEALSFIQSFSQSLVERHPVDRAVAIARQQLLTLYKFNQPAWTLPVLYLHPNFDGQLLSEQTIDITRLPGESCTSGPVAAIRVVDDPHLVWYLYSGVLRVGRRPENDVVIPEPWVSGSHAEIFCRQPNKNVAIGQVDGCYYLRDDSRFGTFCQKAEGWQHVHRQEIILKPGTQIRFGSPQGRLMEFVLEG